MRLQHLEEVMQTLSRDCNNKKKRHCEEVGATLSYGVNYKGRVVINKKKRTKTLRRKDAMKNIGMQIQFGVQM